MKPLVTHASPHGDARSGDSCASVVYLVCLPADDPESSASSQKRDGSYLKFKVTEYIIDF